MLVSEGSYLLGKKNGLWVQWDSAGHTTDSTIYDAAKKIFEVHTGYNKNGTLDSLIKNNIKDDELERTFYNDSGQITSYAKFKGQNGIVKYYDKGVLTSTDTVHSRLEIEAEFEGGEQAWRRYISQQINKHIDLLTRAGQSGTCRVRFIIDAEGRPSNVEAITMQGTALARVAVNAIKNGPKWKPASQYGRFVKAFREQPLSFTISAK